MGGCISANTETNRQGKFTDAISLFPSGDVSKLDTGAGPDVPQMATGRVCAPNGVLTAPISGSPCVAYFYEISEFHFNGMLPHGYGFTKIFAEKKNNAFEIIDPQYPDIRILIDESEAVIDLNKSSKIPLSMEFMTDVALAHVCPVPQYTYDVPHIVFADIQATKNLLRGYPLKFGMLDGEGDGVRVEVPENIEQLFVNSKISRFKEKSWWRRLRESCGKKYDEDEYRTFCMTEMCFRVNDQINVVGGFEADSTNPNIKRVVPLNKDQIKRAGTVSDEMHDTIFKLTEHSKAIVISKFPKVGDTKPLPKGLIWSQEQGVFSNFVLQERVEQNLKDADFRADMHMVGASPHAHHATSPEHRRGHNAAASAEEKQARAYLFTDDANKRLGNQAVQQVIYDE